MFHPLYLILRRPYQTPEAQLVNNIQCEEKAITALNVLIICHNRRCCLSFLSKMYARRVGASSIKQQTYKEKREKKENGVPVQENCFKQVVIPLTVGSETRKISS